MNATANKKDFADRLDELCTDMGLPAERGRQTALAKKFSVTSNAARKWLKGEGMPELDMAIDIAKWGGVNVEWLLSGRGPKRGSTIDTKALVLGEAIQALDAGERKEVLGYLRYKLEHSTTKMLTGGQVTRYMTMLSAFEAEAKEKPRRES